MYIVVWSNQALDRLADYWLTIDSQKRLVIEQQIDALNARLAETPTNVGESRSHNVRITFDAPIAVLFYVDEIDKFVYVTHFWTF